MRMLCYKCSHPWNHKGILTEGKVYVTCPNCMLKIKVDKALVEDPFEQKLLTSLPGKRVKTTSFPLKLLTTTNLERVSSDGFVYLVDKKIAKQFKEAPEELEEDDVEEMQEQEQEPQIDDEGWQDILTETSDAYGKKIIVKKGRRLGEKVSIKILSLSLPTPIQKAFYEKEQEQNNPFLNPPREEPNFEMKIIPRDPIKLLEHQRSFPLR